MNILSYSFPHPSVKEHILKPAQGPGNCYVMAIEDILTGSCQILPILMGHNACTPLHLHTTATTTANYPCVSAKSLIFFTFFLLSARNVALVPVSSSRNVDSVLLGVRAGRSTLTHRWDHTKKQPQDCFKWRRYVSRRNPCRMDMYVFAVLAEESKQSVITAGNLLHQKR